jgi:hypothetical protein
MIEESPEKPLFNSHFVASARYNSEVAKERRDDIGDRRWLAYLWKAVRPFFQ